MHQQQAHHGLADMFQQPDNSGDMVRFLTGLDASVLFWLVLMARAAAADCCFQRAT